MTWPTALGCAHSGYYHIVVAVCATQDKHHVQISHNIITIYQFSALHWGRPSLAMNSQEESGRKPTRAAGKRSHWLWRPAPQVVPITKQSAFVIRK